MDQWEARFTPRTPAPPRLEHVATLFRVKGPSGRHLRCATYRVETGLELRLAYEDRADDLQRSELFRDENLEAIAERADAWHLALTRSGFTELAIV